MGAARAARALLAALPMAAAAAPPLCSAQWKSAWNGTLVAHNGKGGSVDDCCRACSSNSACEHYTWHPDDGNNPSVCYQYAGDGVKSATGRNFSAGEVTARHYCDDDAGCSLAGECRDGVCVCDGWTHGDHCEALNLLPVDPDRLGYRNTSGWNSWGGGALPHGGKWYLFASQIHGRCPLSGYWSKMSEAVRAVSDGPTGPFRADAVVVPSFAHNVKPVRAPDGTWLLYYVGSVNNATEECGNGSGRSLRTGVDPAPKEAAGPVMIASAPAPDTPPDQWELHGPMTDSVGWHSATNPSPVFLPNGSVLLTVSRRWDLGGGRATKNNWAMVADSWRGPYRNITRSFADAADTGEDPDVFVTRRGYHMLNHNTGPASSLLSYSADGITWHRSGPSDAFNATFQWTNGSSTTVVRRQRPRVVFADDGMPGWLWTGVMQGGEECNSDPHAACPTWTLAQQIGRQ